MSTSGLGPQNRRMFAWLAALGAAGLAAAVTLAGPVTAAGKNAPAQVHQAIGYTLPAGWTDHSTLQPQFVAHKAPMCFYQAGDPSKCYVMIQPTGSAAPDVDQLVTSMVGTCLPDRSRPTVAVLNSEAGQLGGHPAQHTRWSATCASGKSMGVQADYVQDLGILVWSYVDSVYGDSVDNTGVSQILGSLTFAGQVNG
ncbi:MAG TPA: hypothetical protein VFX70_12795 [Mycobacteriales bacterium]|nr:hypothetical protein [Mycobacteriales bacterium]